MKKLMLILLSVLILSACQSEVVTGESVTVTGGSYQNVTPDELYTMLRDKDFIFVNVHIPFAGNIASTDLSIPYNELEQNLFQLPPDKSAKIVLYCRSGRMSAIAAEELVSLGYTHIWTLTAGMVEWEQAGFELEEQIIHLLSGFPSQSTSPSHKDWVMFVISRMAWGIYSNLAVSNICWSG